MEEEFLLFSIIIPVFNVEKYLEECLLSIIGQTDEISEGCEIILINDGSTDDSAKICDEYERKYPELIKVFHRSNHGLLLTRRFGYQHAVGRYIINCDSDDSLEPIALEVLKDALVEYNNPDVIIFNQNTYKNGVKEIAYNNIFTESVSAQIDKLDVLKEFLTGNRINSVCGAICKKDCIDINRDYNKYKGLNNGEDSLQKIEQFKSANTFAYINKPLYNYRAGSGMTTKFDRNYFKSFRIVLDEIQKEREMWDFPDVDRYFSIKVLSIAGRAVTQSRYNCWENKSEQIRYLHDIRNDDYFKKAVLQLATIRKYLQKDHILLIKMLDKGLIRLIVLMLDIKNKIG